MAIVKMERAGVYADINSSDECIKQAQREGWSVVKNSDDKDSGAENTDDNDSEKKQKKQKKNK